MKFLVSISTIIFSCTVMAAPVTGQGTWETTLEGRDLDGDLSTFEAYYDTNLNITWLANAYAAFGSPYDTANSTVMDGRMAWNNAFNWASTLNPYNSGITGWRLPNVIDTGTTGCNYAFVGTDCGFNVDVSTSELAHLYYVTLGNIAYRTTTGYYPNSNYGLGNTGPFLNIQTYMPYWANALPGTSSAWGLTFATGEQSVNSQSVAMNVWAVHDGDIAAISGSPVPLPASLWLFTAGGLFLFGRFKRNHV